MNTGPGGDQRRSGTSGRGADPRLLRTALWTAVAPAVATEAGAGAVMVLGVVAGLIVAFLSVLVLEAILPRIRPPASVLRAALLLTGPPLRYALLGLMVWYVWVRRHEGPGPAVGAALALALILPLLAALVARSRYGPRSERRGRGGSGGRG